MPALPPSGVIDVKPSETFGSSVTGIEYGPVVQQSVLRVDVQSSLPGDTDTFTGITMKAKTTFHVFIGGNRADLANRYW